jgi:hypothetical protein
MWGRVVTDRAADAPQWPQARDAEPAQSAEQERDQGAMDIDR